MKMKLIQIITLLTLTASAHAGLDVSKTSITTAPPEEEWHFRFAPYAWVTAIDGDVSVGPLSAPIDVSMMDTLEEMELAAMGIIEASYGRWSVGVDVIYGKVSQDIGGGGLIFDSFRYEQKQWIITPVVGYRVIEKDDYHMDIVAGARVMALEAELTGRFVGPGEISATRDTAWIDPLVGIRGQADFNDKAFFRYYGDIGGFGASSELTWQAFAGLGYNCTPSVSLLAGYRAIGDDYEEGNFELDTVSHGPVLGVEIRW